MIKTYPYYDLVSYKFSYDSEIKEIAVYFDGYFDENEYIEKKWILLIRNWQSAKSKVWNSSEFVDLESNIGVLSMILDMKNYNNILNIVAHTLDDRYIEFEFANSEVVFQDL